MKRLCLAIAATLALGAGLLVIIPAADANPCKRALTDCQMSQATTPTEDFPHDFEALCEA